MSNTNLSVDQINVMNSILDRELDSIKYASSSNYNTVPRDPLISKENSQFSRFDKSTSSFATSHYARPNYTNHNNKSMDPIDSSNKSAKIQEDLLELQNKLLRLEKRISTINSPLKSNENVLNIALLSTSPISKRINNDTLGPKIGVTEFEDTSPMKSKYQSPSIFTISQASEISKVFINRENPLLDTIKEKKESNKANTKIDMNDRKGEERPQENIRKSRKYIKEKDKDKDKDREKSSSLKRVNKFALEQTIITLQSELENTKNQLKRPSKSRSKDSRSGSGRPKTSGSGRRSVGSNSGGELDAQTIKNKLSKLKKQYEEDKSTLIKERIKNQELVAHIEKMSKKLKKMQIEIDKFSKIQTDYNKLMENFDKSEYIRQQQKQLINSLNAEMEQLRKEQLRKMGKPEEKSSKEKQQFENFVNGSDETEKIKKRGQKMSKSKKR